jgi:hypothetical protein
MLGVYSVIGRDVESIGLTYITPPTFCVARYSGVKSKPILVGAPSRGISRVMTTDSVRIFALTPTLQVFLIQRVLFVPRATN